ncbi:MAG: hypothetical protein QME96_17280, partial [Myxococcota bacterium]|nr:hypothetical protein [Myxococcota bacterium]
VMNANRFPACGAVLALGLIVVLAPAPAAAQDRWSTVVVACENMLTNGLHENVTHVLQREEGGYRAQLGGGSTGGRTYVCPVTLGHDVTVNKISIRAYDNDAAAGNYVAAIFWRQPWLSGSGDAVMIAWVVSENSANQPHVTTFEFPDPPPRQHIVDNVQYTYFVTVTLSRAVGNQYPPRAYQVRIFYSAGAAAGESVTPSPEVRCDTIMDRPEWAIHELERLICFGFPE